MLIVFTHCLWIKMMRSLRLPMVDTVFGAFVSLHTLLIWDHWMCYLVGTIYIIYPLVDGEKAI